MSISSYIFILFGIVVIILGGAAKIFRLIGN